MLSEKPVNILDSRYRFGLRRSVASVLAAPLKYQANEQDVAFEKPLFCLRKHS